MTPVNRKAGTGERTREPPGGNAGIFKVLSGFATTDLSVKFCDACQGAKPMENALVGHGFIVLVLAFRYAYRLRYLSLRKMRPLAADK